MHEHRNDADRDGETLDPERRRLYEAEQDEISDRLKVLYEQVRKEEARNAELERLLHPEDYR